MSGLTDKQVLELIDVYCMFEEIEGPIFNFVHSQLSKYEDGCGNPHEDWREQTIEAYQDFVKMGELKEVEDCK